MIEIEYKWLIFELQKQPPYFNFTSRVGQKFCRNSILWILIWLMSFVCFTLEMFLTKKE